MEADVRVLQDRFASNPPEQSIFFTKNFKQVAKGFDAFKPSLLIDEKLSNTLPAGARMIEIDIPFFALILTHSDGGLKVFRTAFHVH